MILFFNWLRYFVYIFPLYLLPLLFSLNSHYPFIVYLLIAPLSGIFCVVSDEWYCFLLLIIMIIMKTTKNSFFPTYSYRIPTIAFAPISTAFSFSSYSSSSLHSVNHKFNNLCIHSLIHSLINQSLNELLAKFINELKNACKYEWIN